MTTTAIDTPLVSRSRIRILLALRPRRWSPFAVLAAPRIRHGGGYFDAAQRRPPGSAAAFRPDIRRCSQHARRVAPTRAPHEKDRERKACQRPEQRLRAWRG